MQIPMFKLTAVAAVATGLLATGLAAATDPVPSATDGAAVAEIPAGSDLSSIRFEGIKLVKSLPPTYQITYSYNGPPLGGDEYGGTHLTFSVNVRPEDQNQNLREAVSARHMNRAATAEDFKLTTYRALVPRVVIDESNSTFCAGNYSDGLWTQTDRNCEERVFYKTVAVPSGYIAVRVDPVAGAPATTARR